jgi:hypothetical protein
MCAPNFGARFLRLGGSSLAHMFYQTLNLGVQKRGQNGGDDIRNSAGDDIRNHTLCTTTENVVKWPSLCRFSTISTMRNASDNMYYANYRREIIDWPVSHILPSLYKRFDMSSMLYNLQSSDEIRRYACHAYRNTIVTFLRNFVTQL